MKRIMVKRMKDNRVEVAPWDLGFLYEGRDDPRLLGDMGTARERAQQFADAYRGRPRGDLDDATLVAALREYEQIHEIGMRPYFFATLLFSEQTQDPKRRELLDEIRERWNAIECLLVFFRLEMRALPENRIRGTTREMTRHGGLSGYRHFLLHQRRWRPYTIEESEEIAAVREELAGRSALLASLDTITGALSVSVPGEDHALKMDEVLGMLHRPDPAPRARAFDGLLQAVAQQGGLFADTMNALLTEHSRASRQRGHPFPMHKSLLSNGVEEALIEGMMRCVEKHYPMARRYFRLKARFLGLERMHYTDQFVPPRTKKAAISFPTARSVLLASMEAFHPRFYGAAKEFFDKRRVDGAVRPGKMDGAFCKSFAPSLPPCISMNYTGHLRDLMVLAHEIGHGMHFTFSRGMTYLNYASPPLLSETAAVFCEMIVADHMLGETGLPSWRENVLACHIEGILTTVFRQTVLTRFEQAIHGLRQDHPLSEEEICQCWWDANLRLYGEDLALPALYRWGWACVPHLFHRHFYCYNYIFGNLCAILLFQKCRARTGFTEDVIRLFSRGGSEGPLVMLRELGFDFTEASAWETSFVYMETLIDRLEDLESESSKRDSSGMTPSIIK